MKTFKHAVAALVLTGSFAAPALAQGEGPMNLGESQITMTSPSGVVVQKKITDAAMADMMMKDAMPMTAGVMMMMHGGKMYMITDKKMPGGKMMSDMVMGK